MAGMILPEEVQPDVLSAKLQIRLLTTLKIAKYYELTLRPLTPSNMSWAITKNFEKQLNVLMDNNDSLAPSVSKLMKGLPV